MSHAFLIVTKELEDKNRIRMLSATLQSQLKNQLTNDLKQYEGTIFLERL